MAKLKNALSSQQSRLQKKKQSSKATANIDLNNKMKKQSMRGKKKNDNGNQIRPPTIPFRATDKILLIGEGNFSFALAIVQHPPPTLLHFPPQNLTATTYDTEAECCTKYPDAAAILTSLREKGVEVLFQVDATRLGKNPAFKRRRWDRIVWNFPHAGRGISDQDRNIHVNQVLILDFLREAAGCLTRGPVPIVSAKRKRKSDEEAEADDISDEEGGDEDGQVQARGTVLITLRNVAPYTSWDIPRLAKKPPPSTSTPPAPVYTLLRSFAFRREAWRGYEHRMTKGERRGVGVGVGGEERTWEFCVGGEE